MMEGKLKQSICVLGTGLMGSAIVRALLGKGYTVSAWNRTIAKASPLADDGARIATSVADGIEHADIVITNVLDYGATSALLRQPDSSALLRDKILIELTSGSPAEARDSSAWAERHGTRYLDGAILATPNLMGTSDAVIVVSGEHSTYTSVSELMATMATTHHVGEDAGLANAVDTANLSMMWGCLFGALHAVAVSKAEGVSFDLLEQLWESSAPVVQGMVSDLIRRTSAGRFEQDEETMSTVSTHFGALKHLIAVMDDRGLDRAVVDGYSTLFRKAERAGKLHSDFCVMSSFMASADELNQKGKA